MYVDIRYIPYIRYIRIIHSFKFEIPAPSLLNNISSVITSAPSSFDGWILAFYALTRALRPHILYSCLHTCSHVRLLINYGQ